MCRTNISLLVYTIIEHQYRNFVFKKKNIAKICVSIQYTSLQTWLLSPANQKPALILIGSPNYPTPATWHQWLNKVHHKCTPNKVLLQSAKTVFLNIRHHFLLRKLDRITLINFDWIISNKSCKHYLENNANILRPTVSSKIWLSVNLDTYLKNNLIDAYHEIPMKYPSMQACILFKNVNEQLLQDLGEICPLLILGYHQARFHHLQQPQSLDCSIYSPSCAAGPWWNTAPMLRLRNSLARLWQVLEVDDKSSNSLKCRQTGPT